MIVYLHSESSFNVEVPDCDSGCAGSSPASRTIFFYMKDQGYKHIIDDGVVNDEAIRFIIGINEGERYIKANGEVTQPLTLQDGVYRDGGTFTWGGGGLCRETFDNQHDLRYPYYGSMREVVDKHRDDDFDSADETTYDLR